MLGEAIRHYRSKLNITQQELAALIPCSIDSIRRWETNLREPRASDLVRLCEVLQCSESELLNGPSDGKIKVTISYDWDKFEKGEINMDGNLFELFMGKLGEIGIKGAGLPKSVEEKEELKKKICDDIDNMFDLQVKRGAILLA